MGSSVGTDTIDLEEPITLEKLTLGFTGVRGENFKRVISLAGVRDALDRLVQKKAIGSLKISVMNQDMDPRDPSEKRTVLSAVAFTYTRAEDGRAVMMLLGFGVVGGIDDNSTIINLFAKERAGALAEFLVLGSSEDYLVIDEVEIRVPAAETVHIEGAGKAEDFVRKEALVLGFEPEQISVFKDTESDAKGIVVRAGSPNETLRVILAGRAKRAWLGLAINSGPILIDSLTTLEPTGSAPFMDAKIKRQDGGGAGYASVLVDVIDKETKKHTGFVGRALFERVMYDVPRTALALPLFMDQDGSPTHMLMDFFTRCILEFAYNEFIDAVAKSTETSGLSLHNYVYKPSDSKFATLKSEDRFIEPFEQEGIPHVKLYRTVDSESGLLELLREDVIDNKSIHEAALEAKTHQKGCQSHVHVAGRFRV